MYSHSKQQIHEPRSCLAEVEIVFSVWMVLFMSIASHIIYTGSFLLDQRLELSLGEAKHVPMPEGGMKPPHP